MKNKQITLFILLIFVVFQSCNSNYLNYKAPKFIVDELNEINTKPDSLLRDELKNKKEQMYQILNEHVKVENNHIITTATPQIFKEKGLSEEYYKLLVKSINETNKYVKRNKITNLNEMIERAKESF